MKFHDVWKTTVEKKILNRFFFEGADHKHQHTQKYIGTPNEKRIELYFKLRNEIEGC